MKSHFVRCLLATAVLMLLIPWLTVILIRGDAGMAVCFILFFAVNPLYAACCGFFAGRDLKKRWYFPILPAVLFVLGTWIVFEMGEPAFLMYAGVYAMLGFAAMLLASLLKRGRDR